MRLVGPEGPLDARIVLIGQEPGRTELETGRPFSGASGNLLAVWWEEVGLKRWEVRIDNVLHYLPKGKIGGLRGEEILEEIGRLHQRIAELVDPVVLVPTGNYACWALTGKGKVKAGLLRAARGWGDATEAEKRAGITELRGGIYEYTDLKGRKMKVIPSIHPSWFLRGQLAKQKVAIADWRRIKRESEFRELRVPERVHRIEPTEREVSEYCRFVSERPGLKLAVDIETWGNTLSCVGFSHSKNFSITIPVSSKEERGVFLPYVKWLCESENEKILQNGLFDAYWLREYGIELRGWVWDTMCMHCAIDPVSAHDLNFLCSIYLPFHRYWKDEAKEAEEIVKYVKDLQALWVYNGLDCCCTRELFDVLYGELVREGMLGFYLEHYAAMFEPLLGMMRHGVRVDGKRMNRWARELLKDCEKLREELKELAGEELYAVEKEGFYRDATEEELRELFGDKRPENRKERYRWCDREAAKRLRYVMSKGVVKDYRVKLKKDFSRVKLERFLHERLKLPRQKKWVKGERRETLDEAALKRLLRKYERAREPILKILEHRSKKKEAVDMRRKWDKDGRMRCSFKLTTEAGRLASSKNPMGKGRNLQNLKHPGPRVNFNIRKGFLPDEGCVFVRFDLSQIEDRIVKMYTRSKRMVKMARLRPEEFDAHTHNAAGIFGISEGEVTKEQRQLGKFISHAAQRGMRGRKLSDKLLKDLDVYIEPRECDRFIDRYLAENWEIRDFYFPWVRERVQREGVLVNSWGRRLDLRHMPLVDDVYRKGYSFYPQSECADLTNRWGVRVVWDFLKRGGLRSRLNMQVHDELILSCPIEEAWTVACFVTSTLERERFYFGEGLVVPCGVTVGSSWADERFEFKRLPEREKFLEAVRECLSQEVRDG